MDTLFQRQVAHLAQWAQNPGTVDQAKHRVRELEACQSGLWTGLRAALRAQLGQAKVLASGHPLREKPP